MLGASPASCLFDLCDVPWCGPPRVCGHETVCKGCAPMVLKVNSYTCSVLCASVACALTADASFLMISAWQDSLTAIDGRLTT